MCLRPAFTEYDALGTPIKETVWLGATPVLVLAPAQSTDIGQDRLTGYTRKPGSFHLLVREKFREDSKTAWLKQAVFERFSILDE